MAAYTAQFGNGFSGTVAAELPRLTQIIGEAGSPAAYQQRHAFVYPECGLVGGTVGGGYAGFQSPDIVANLRVDQAWGSAQIMGAAAPGRARRTIESVDSDHELGGGPPGRRVGLRGRRRPQAERADDRPRRLLQAEVNYAQGASGYMFSPQISAFNHGAASR